VNPTSTAKTRLEATAVRVRIRTSVWRREGGDGVAQYTQVAARRGWPLYVLAVPSGERMASPLLMESLAATRRYVGTAVGPTPWIEIDGQRVQRFLEATSDESSRSGPGANRAQTAPGSLLLSLVPDLLPRLIALEGWTRGVNAGVDDCRFPTPVPVGARVRMSARLDRARGIPGGGVRLSFEVRFELEGSELPACTAMVHYAYFP